jgi:hypothetical protein
MELSGGEREWIASQFPAVNAVDPHRDASCQAPVGAIKEDVTVRVGRHFF